MKINSFQSTKRVTRHEIILTTTEAVKLIQGLASGVMAVGSNDWNRFNSGFFLINEHNNAMVLVEKE
jgi:hypothetical protein